MMFVKKTVQAGKMGKKMFILNLNIRGKLIAGFLVVIILMLGIFGVGYYGINYTGKAADNVAIGEKEQFLWAKWSADVNATIADYENYFYTKNESWLQAAAASIESADSQEKQLSQITNNA